MKWIHPGPYKCEAFDFLGTYCREWLGYGTVRQVFWEYLLQSYKTFRFCR